MFILWWIIVGLIAGWLTGKIMSGGGKPRASRLDYPPSEGEQFAMQKEIRNSPLQSGGEPVQARFHLLGAERRLCSGLEGRELRSHP
jgi:hypothetical protein